jgi:hypothetical protein
VEARPFFFFNKAPRSFSTPEVFDTFFFAVRHKNNESLAFCFFLFGIINCDFEHLRFTILQNKCTTKNKHATEDTVSGKIVLRK